MAESDPRADSIEWTRPILLLAGPTASGKSRLALDLARRRDAVILNADSQQLYADLRVLTARPSVEDEALAEHRLYGVADAADAWSVGRWLRAIDVELAALAREGRPAIVVGGTGLYFRALTGGLADIPRISVEDRDAASALFDAEGEPAFRARLAAVDARSAARIASGDRQRLVRAYAVATYTGRTLGEWQAATQPLLPPQTFEPLVLEPSRSNLYAACDARSRTILDGGAVEEVARLAARHLPPDRPVMKAVGVREISGLIEGRHTRETALAALARSTRQYAKRQTTWFRNQIADWTRA